MLSLFFFHLTTVGIRVLNFTRLPVHTHVDRPKEEFFRTYLLVVAPTGQSGKFERQEKQKTANSNNTGTAILLHTMTLLVWDFGWFCCLRGDVVIIGDGVIEVMCSFPSVLLLSSPITSVIGRVITLSTRVVSLRRRNTRAMTKEDCSHVCF